MTLKVTIKLTNKILSKSKGESIATDDRII